ncbi:alpha-ketoglutarate-dependent dioxygenase AlkB family protein [Reichenbachiella versicolor]|uniref:alpha-ketoglutarate-dependent dioxygenase AlkB family protein n=1 Tax=Reichenbachiella versicolor TaxID=1821036 RepID=UPI000D6E9933|nr:alpha-ketoglutarate-dependent dioxygenase AlkB [Reichenbachiella versicolor]
MDLFETSENENILPFDGEVKYYGSILNIEKARYYYDRLFEGIQWECDKAIIFGKLIYTKRKVAWYGDKPFSYTYSKTTKSALPWTKDLLELKALVQEKTGESFNSCLLNLYHDGEEGMAWHSDGEKDLKKNGAIASLSFGAERKFSFKHKESKQTVSVHLEKGSLLVMKGETQTHWLHRLPPTKKVRTPRINLTFRTIDR